MNRFWLSVVVCLALSPASAEAAEPTEPTAVLIAHMEDGGLVELGRVPTWKFDTGVALRWPPGTEFITIINIGPIRDNCNDFSGGCQCQ